MQALSGFMVLDFGHYIPGPNAAILLEDQGADCRTSPLLGQHTEKVLLELGYSQPEVDRLVEKKIAFLVEKIENAQESDPDQTKKDIQYVLADQSNYW